MPAPIGDLTVDGRSVLYARRNAVFGPGQQLPLDFSLDDLDEASTFEAIDAGRRPSAIGLERIGESDEFAELMLALLKRHGWSIDRPDAFAGDGVFLIATREWREARGAGKSLGAAVAALVADVATFYGVRQLKSA